MHKGLSLFAGMLVLGCGLAAVAEEAQPAAPTGGPEGGRVVITLRAEVTVTDRTVLLGNVATVEGGPAQLRRQLAQLDLAELTATTQNAVISKQQVNYRIQLAGVEPRQFRLEGSATVRVRLGGRRQFGEEDLLMALRQALLKRVPWKSDEVLLRLEEPVPLPASTTEATDELRVTAELSPTTNLLGRVAFVATLHRKGAAPHTLTGFVEIKLMQEVAVATRRIERGELLSQENLHLDRRAVDGTASNPLPYADSATGKRAKRPILPGQAVTSADVEATATDNPILVKPRQTVKIVAKVGALRVTAVGETLQEGRVGQVIKVRNVDSKQTVQARVVDRSTVEVEF